MDSREKVYIEKIDKLEVENTALKNKINSMYASWVYDYARFTELKEILKIK